MSQPLTKVHLKDPTRYHIKTKTVKYTNLIAFATKDKNRSDFEALQNQNKGTPTCLCNTKHFVNNRECANKYDLFRFKMIHH